MPISIPMHSVARILGRHGLGRVSVEPLPGGQINASYLVDGLYVLRINLRPDEYGKLAREQRVLAMLRDLMPVPETIAYDNSGTIIPHEFMIQSYVPGQSLLNRWPKADAVERSGYVAQLAALLRRLHSVRLSAFGDPTNPRLGDSWAALHVRRSAHALQVAREADNAPAELIDQAERVIAHDSMALTGGYPTLTHGDLHFGNIHVQDGAITGLLDFERAWSAAPDWDLDQIVRFVHYPHLFTEPSLDGALHPSRFGAVIPALRAGYPDLFNVNSLGARLRVYALQYDLRALASARKRHNTDATLTLAIGQRITDTLNDSFPGF